MLSGSRANALQFLERRKRGGMASGMARYVSGMWEIQPRWKTLDEARNLFVERPQLRRGKNAYIPMGDATESFHPVEGREKIGSVLRSPF